MPTAGWRVVRGLPVALLLAACATGGGPARRVQGEEVRVEVHNDLVPQGPITVRMVTSTGRRVILGEVGPGQIRTLSYAEPNLGGSHRLVAEPNSGAALVSQAFTLVPQARVIWTLRNNLIRIADPT